MIYRRCEQRNECKGRNRTWVHSWSSHLKNRGVFNFNFVELWFKDTVIDARFRSLHDILTSLSLVKTGNRVMQNIQHDEDSLRSAACMACTVALILNHKHQNWWASHTWLVSYYHTSTIFHHLHADKNQCIIGHVNRVSGSG